MTAVMEPSTFEYVRDLVRQHSAIALESNKGYLVESRLTPVAKQHGMDSLDAFVGSLRGKPFGRLHAQLVEAMTTNETSFFRDFHPFDALKDEVIPQLLRAREAKRTLNIWSAACSTGQEPYTLVMLLREHFPQLAGWTVRLLATDLSSQVLQKAQEGVYTQAEINRGLPAPLLIKYFDRVGLQWRIKEDVRRSVEFKRLNLIEPWPLFPQLDLVFMRNVLIYFTPTTKQQILTNVRKQLAADGALFLGAAETTIGLDDSFVRVSHGKSSMYVLRK
jgi:chemotaxis protein methyltransferase CheR